MTFKHENGQTYLLSGIQTSGKEIPLERSGLAWWGFKCHKFHGQIWCQSYQKLWSVWKRADLWSDLDKFTFSSSVTVSQPYLHPGLIPARLLTGRDFVTWLQDIGCFFSAWLRLYLRTLLVSNNCKDQKSPAARKWQQLPQATTLSCSFYGNCDKLTQRR